MRAWDAVLQALHMEQPLFEIDLIPAQRHNFRNAKAMAIRHLDHRCVAGPVPSDATRCLDRLLDFARCQVLSSAPLRVRNSLRWRHFPIFSYSRGPLWALHVTLG